MNVFKWVNGWLYCSVCCSREYCTRMEHSHDKAVEHHQVHHGDLAFRPLLVPCCFTANRLRGLEHHLTCPNWESTL